jgi:hypothetical protein
MSVVERLRVPAFQQLEAAGQLGLRGVEDEVEVCRHEAERVHRPPVPLDAPRYELEEVTTILVVAEDRAAVDATREDVEVPVGQ